MKFHRPEMSVDELYLDSSQEIEATFLKFQFSQSFV